MAALKRLSIALAILALALVPLQVVAEAAPVSTEMVAPIPAVIDGLAPDPCTCVGTLQAEFPMVDIDVKQTLTDAMALTTATRDDITSIAFGAPMTQTRLISVTPVETSQGYAMALDSNDSPTNSLAEAPTGDVATLLTTVDRFGLIVQDFPALTLIVDDAVADDYLAEGIGNMQRTETVPRRDTGHASPTMAILAGKERTPEKPGTIMWF